MQIFSSSSFKDGVNQLFASDTSQTMRWCPDHVVDFQWQDTNLAPAAQAKWSQAKPEQIKKAFCSITMDSGKTNASDQLNLSQLQFKPLLLAQSAEAKTALLEWNPESKAFRVQGMLFKSASLSRELLDDPK